MNHAPQIAILCWLIVASIGSTWKIARPGIYTAVVVPRDQRRLAMVVLCAVLSEAATLWLGGFFS